MYLKLLTIRKAGTLSGQAGVLLKTGEILDLSFTHGSPSLGSWIPESIRDILEAGDEGLEIVRKYVTSVEAANESERERLRERRALLPFERTPLLAPVPQPSLITCLANNYRSHQNEMGSPIPPEPEGFVKHTSAVTGPGAPIILPHQFPDMVDFEGEFAFVFGRPCHKVRIEDAMGYVAGYTIINDVSARNWVQGTIRPKDPAEGIRAWRINTMGKQLPTFCPMGPVLVTRDEIPDPNNLSLTTMVNGKVMQSANTSDLCFNVKELIAYFSQWYQFYPGDVIATGTPSGVGFARSPKVFLKAGDIVTIEVEGVGTLSNPVVAA
jgi:acylpyruvate hydrolase